MAALILKFLTACVFVNIFSYIDDSQVRTKVDHFSAVTYAQIHYSINLKRGKRSIHELNDLLEETTPFLIIYLKCQSASIQSALDESLLVYGNTERHKISTHLC